MFLSSWERDGPALIDTQINWFWRMASIEVVRMILVHLELNGRPVTLDLKLLFLETTASILRLHNTVAQAGIQP